MNFMNSKENNMIDFSTLYIRGVRLVDFENVSMIENCVFGKDAFTKETLLYQMNESIKGTEGTMPWDELKYMFGVLVYPETEMIVGYFILRFNKGNASVSLHNFAIHPEFQGNGIGLKLMKKVMDAVRATKFQKIYLEVSLLNYRAIEMYRKLGFTINKKLPKYYANGVDGIRMACILK